MAKKRNSGSEPLVSTGASPARKKAASSRTKHSPGTQVESFAPAETSPAAPFAMTASGPNYDEIARLAYSYWEQRGFQGGSPEEDWLRAEQELRNRLSSAAIA